MALPNAMPRPTNGSGGFSGTQPILPRGKKSRGGGGSGKVAPFGKSPKRAGPAKNGCAGG